MARDCTRHRLPTPRLTVEPHAAPRAATPNAASQRRLPCCRQSWPAPRPTSPNIAARPLSAHPRRPRVTHFPRHPPLTCRRLATVARAAAAPTAAATRRTTFSRRCSARASKGSRRRATRSCAYRALSSRRGVRRRAAPSCWRSSRPCGQSSSHASAFRAATPATSPRPCSRSCRPRRARAGPCRCPSPIRASGSVGGTTLPCGAPSASPSSWR
mmetsp:Transcript_466/g.1523  ORF Transcript_466/g.1523 Transcript_466/m.1523 type:complete len:214 (+) Transcript_466:301-942(+)